MKRKKPDRKARPINEVTEDEVAAVLQAIKDFSGYPRLRDVAKMFPSMHPVKINTILRFLERTKSIIIDSDSYIVWTKSEPERMTLADVAVMSDDLRQYLEKAKDES